MPPSNPFSVQNAAPVRLFHRCTLDLEAGAWAVFFGIFPSIDNINSLNTVTQELLVAGESNDEGTDPLGKHFAQCSLHIAWCMFTAYQRRKSGKELLEVPAKHVVGEGLEGTQS